MSTEYSGLRFERPSRTVPRRLVFIGVMYVIFNLLWWLVPRDTQYWALLLTLVIFAWAASHGWRQAIATIHNLLHDLEQG